ncbi:hypothetical protein AB6A40_010760 [Gnathostoma spinigerum]|uniref:Uncharacterized protein n=1 Tax=Gnathostoma spinigerum TaxID=75299 RepID=A0ABD6EVY0_9BILA
MMRRIYSRDKVNRHQGTINQFIPASGFRLDFASSVCCHSHWLDLQNATRRYERNRENHYALATDCDEEIPIDNACLVQMHFDFVSVTAIDDGEACGIENDSVI